MSGKNGELATLQGIDERVTLVLPEGGVGYERIFGVTQVETERQPSTLAVLTIKRHFSD